MMPASRQELAVQASGAFSIWLSSGSYFAARGALGSGRDCTASIAAI